MLKLNKIPPHHFLYVDISFWKQEFTHFCVPLKREKTKDGGGLRRRGKEKGKEGKHVPELPRSWRGVPSNWLRIEHQKLISKDSLGCPYSGPEWLRMSLPSLVLLFLRASKCLCFLLSSFLYTLSLKHFYKGCFLLTVGRLYWWQAILLEKCIDS